jgi:hypothetical protein
MNDVVSGQSTVVGIEEGAQVLLRRGGVGGPDPAPPDGGQGA